MSPKRCMLAVLALVATGACAHDTWFEVQPDAAERRLVLGTGNVFPLRDSGIDPQYLRRPGCLGAAGALPLRVRESTETALFMAADTAAQSCWTQLTPFEIELAPDKIDLYLREVRPPQAMLDLWAQRHARGLPWREHYTKHARVDWPGAGAAAAAPSGMGMDVLVESEAPYTFRVLRDGAPLPGLAVEFRHESARFGVWRRTDGEGRVAFTPPLPGAWVLRGVDLRPSTSEADAWDSRFVTLAFQVR